MIVLTEEGEQRGDGEEGDEGDAEETGEGAEDVAAEGGSGLPLAVLGRAGEKSGFPGIERQGTEVLEGNGRGQRREVEVVDAHDFISDGGKHSALVAEIYPAELSVGVQLQKMQFAADAEEIQAGEGEPGFAHEGADSMVLIGCQRAGLPRLAMLKGEGAAVRFRQLRTGKG